MILVDTGYFLGLAVESDGLHAGAVAWSSAVRERLLVTEYVLLEVVNTLPRRRLREVAHEIIDEVMTGSDYEFIVVDDQLRTAAIELHRERTDKDWSLTDCVSFVIMQRRGITRALAFDVHFEQAGFEALLRRDP